MGGSAEEIIRELQAREHIRDLLYRYCRAADRADEAGLRACYWPDAVDNHGPVKGPVGNFLAWASQVLPTIERGIHQLHNILIEFKEGGAAVETYWSSFERKPGPDGVMRQWALKGRYIDWIVERSGEWRILDRLVVFDWVEELPVPTGSEEERFGLRQPIGGRWPDDPVYRARP